MVTFVQDTQGAQPVGIGNQRIVTPDNSYIDQAARGADQALNVLDKAGDYYAENTAQEIASDAMATVDQERREQEEVQKLIDPDQGATAFDVARRVALLDKGVKAGRMTRENARLRTADIVTAAIAEEPMFEDKIRASASRLLGFDPTSEATRQFFSSFQPAGAASERKLTEFEKLSLNLQSTSRMSKEAADELASQVIIGNAQKTALDNRLATGGMTADSYIAQGAALESESALREVFGDMRQTFNQGGAIDAAAYTQAIDQRKAAYIQRTNAALVRSEIPLTTEAQAQITATAETIFKDLYDFAENMDENMLNERNLERLVTSQKLFANQAMPTFSFLVNAFGDRIAGQVMDIFADSGGNPQKIQAILGSNPALAGFVELSKQDPRAFAQGMMESLRKLKDPNADLTAQDSGLIDIFLGRVVKDGSPEEVQTAVEDLLNHNLNTKAVSLLASKGVSTATPANKTLMKNEWATTQEFILPDLQQVLTNENATVAVNPDGTLRLVPTETRAQGGGRRTVSPESSEGYRDLQKLNLFLSARNRGWGTELGMNDRTPQTIADQLNTRIETPEVLETTVRSGRSSITRPMTVEERRARYEELLRKRAEGAE